MKRIRRKKTPIHMLGTKSRKDAYGRALDILAKKFNRQKYVCLEPVSTEIGKQLRDFVEESSESCETIEDANAMIMDRLFEMISKEQFEIKKVEYLVIPNGAVRGNGDLMPIDPHGEEAEGLRKILRLHV